MRTHAFQHEAMATHWEIAIAGQEERYARHAAEAAFRELDRLETLLSRYVESSDISRINGLALGESTMIGDETLECLLIAADVALVTNRAFDPAYASERPTDLPATALPYTLDPDTRALTSLATRLHIDLGAVGKGYALDQMAALLREWSVTDACLNGGGSSVLAFGAPSRDATGWPVGLGEGPGSRTFALSGASLSGSGTAVQGAHLIDPRTGRAATRTERAWAYAPTAAQADALSTAFFLMNESELAALCTAHPRIGGALAGAGGGLVLHGALRAAAGGKMPR